jgi:hypothetical protein
MFGDFLVAISGLISLSPESTEWFSSFIFVQLYFMTQEMIHFGEGYM